MTRFIIGPPSHHDDLLPPGQLVEEPVLVARLDLLVLRGAGVARSAGRTCPVLERADLARVLVAGPGGSIPTILT